MRIKCPHCNGKGFSELNSVVNMTCGWCMGQGELDLEIVPTEQTTNEYFLRTATTEQLAELLCDVWYGIDEAINIMSEDGEISQKDAMKMWLKQPHTRE